MIFAQRATEADAPVLLAARGRSSRWEEGALTVLADADIDNAAALAAAGLPLSPHASAAEIIGKAFARWSDGCAERLLGDFAFVVWDAERRRLHAARDPLGIRPLYRRERGGVLTLGSVAREVAGPDARPDALGISLYIVGRHQEDGYTLFEAVEALPAGHRLVADERGTERTRFYELAPSAFDVDDEATLAQRFAFAFREAVSCRVTSRTAVVVSGGLDSSSVAGQAAVVADAPVTALHLAFPGIDCDESHYCDAVVRRHELALIRHDARETSISHNDGDHPDLVFDPTVGCFDPLFAAAAAAGVSTVLTGIGGDQLTDESGLECADALRDGRLRDAARIAGITRRPTSLTSYQNLLAWGVRPLIPEPIRAASRRLRRRPTLEPLTPRSRDRALEHVYAEMRRAARRPGGARGMRHELACQSLLWPVLQSSRVAARHGLGVRHPFLDVRLVELMLGVPARARFRDGVTKGKPLLRRALGALLPTEVATRTDAGEFSDYLRYVLLQRGKRQTTALFAESRLADLGIIDQNAMRDVLEGSSPLRIKRLKLATGMELWLRRTWA